jgi:hypothetical protein
MTSNLDNLDNLDEEGHTLYNDYENSLNKWCSYIRTKTIIYLNNYLESKGKLFDKNEFYTATYSKYINNNINTNIINNKDFTAKYKKLSLLLHPDKFNNPKSTELFALVNKFYNDGNEYIINLIDNVSQYILEIDDLTNIIENLNNTNIKKMLTQNEDTKTLFNILNNNLKNININVNCEPNSNSNKNEEFISSIQYKFYIGCQNTINYINNTFITENELIDKIKNTPIYENELINFYQKKYGHNSNILIACTEWFMKSREHLKKENEELRNKITKLNNKE